MAVIGRATAPALGMMRWIFSANVSPLGLPQGVADAIVAALPTADRYPDPFAESCARHSAGRNSCRNRGFCAATGRRI